MPVSAELRSPAPLAPVRILRRPTVKWGNYAGLVVLAMETGMIFLMTLYLQRVLRFSPLATGLIFGVPGLASVAAGVMAGRFIGRFGSRKVLAAGMCVQGLATLPLVFLGTGRVALAVLVPALFTGFFGHVTSIVAYTVTGTSGLPGRGQGLATGLTWMTMQVAITVGFPVLSSVAATQSVELAGIHLALAVGVAVTLVSVIFVWFGLRPRGEPHMPATAAGRALAPGRCANPRCSSPNTGVTSERQVAGREFTESGKKHRCQDTDGGDHDG